MSEVGQQVGQAAQQVVNAAVIRPGDTLIIAVGHQMSAYEVDQLRAEVKERLDVDVALIENATGLAVYRPGEG